MMPVKLYLPKLPALPHPPMAWEMNVSANTVNLCVVVVTKLGERGMTDRIPRRFLPASQVWK